MPQAELEKIISKMIQVELEAMRYYRKATEVMQDEGAIFHFNLLADEELEHARSFYEIYPGNDLAPFEKLVAEDSQNRPIETIDIGLMARLDERQALQLALRFEKEVEGKLRSMAMEIHNEAARAVILQNAESTQNHYQLLAEDYQRLYGHLD